MFKITKAKILLTLLFWLTATSRVFAAETIDATIDAFFKDKLSWFSDLIFTAIPVQGTSFPLIVGWLGLGAIVFTLYFGFVQFRYFGLALKVVSGKTSYNASKAPGETSHFQALTTALSGTVGLGNIAGVGTALAIGGPGATFWMIIIGLCGMASKFVECTLGVKYRQISPTGVVSGGAMYYLTQGLAEKGMPKLGKFLALGFAIMTVFAALGAGNMFQGNQTHAMISSTFGVLQGQGWVTGSILAVLVFGVLMGGMPSLARLTSALVPVMAVLYLAMGVYVIAANYTQVGAAFQAIIDGAFTGAGVTGGVLGALIQGLKRATFSNEAGVGSAAIAHSAVRTDYPVSEGLVSLLEPFIDTVIICTMTALVITIAGLNVGPFSTDNALSGVELTSLSFQQTAVWLKYPLAIAIALFALSTMFTWSYYGLKAWEYLFGHHAISSFIYKIIFCVFIIVGCSTSFSAILDFSDASFFTMAIFNMIGLYLLMPVVKQELDKFLTAINYK